ncbi:hypothetical protein GUJ93_ZPchr0006g44250 [Zizania palustris]|uniref:Uncharacterized protein n=1 Tax=Zizania palustris TaxID=103762 RepID=A0A8J5VMS3_ZIZPA|nr:hypothetical protein GUJ93_ZPchr0006g44250 [Zizania palustris]
MCCLLLLAVVYGAADAADVELPGGPAQCRAAKGGVPAAGGVRAELRGGAERRLRAHALALADWPYGGEVDNLFRGGEWKALTVYLLLPFGTSDFTASSPRGDGVDAVFRRRSWRILQEGAGHLRRAPPAVVSAATVVAPKVGAQVIYSKYAGTEVELNDSNHLILKEDDIIGILETDDSKDMKPLGYHVLIKVAEA